MTRFNATWLGYAGIALPVLLLIVLLGGCATPYQELVLDPRGGYADVEEEPGVFFVSFRGADWTTESTRRRITEFWHRRAAELCGGSGSYQVLELEIHEEPFNVDFLPTWLMCSFEAEGSIRCNAAQSAEDEAVRQQLRLEMEKTRRQTEDLRKELEIKPEKDPSQDR